MNPNASVTTRQQGRIRTTAVNFIQPYPNRWACWRKAIGKARERRGERKGGEGEESALIKLATKCTVQTYPRLVTLPVVVAEKNPNCLQATLPSLKLNPLSHTVPHSPCKKISSRPSLLLVENELTSLKSPSSTVISTGELHVHRVPKCTQTWQDQHTR